MIWENRDFQAIFASDRVLDVEGLRAFCAEILPCLETEKSKKTVYYTCPAAFDLEASSFTSPSGDKAATMYVWMFGLFGAVVLGRTWEEFELCCSIVTEELRLDIQHRLIVYVHSLEYDFQFFRKHLAWSSVFSLHERKPLYAVSVLGIEFRCSYLLTGKSLAALAEGMEEYPELHKMVGDLDYSVPRHSGTPLTKTELGYCFADVRILMAYISTQIQEEGGILNIPLTKTGYVRRYARRACLPDDAAHEPDKLEYQKLMVRMSMRLAEYDQIRRAFQGGYTHGSPLYIGQTIEDPEGMESWDICSSYPAQLVRHKYPMGHAQLVNINSRTKFEYNVSHYACIFDLELWGVRSKLIQDHYISASRCWELEGEQTANGRIVKADHLKISITNVDWEIIKECYDWEGTPAIGVFRRYEWGYLPTPFVKAVLDLYVRKSTLKGVPQRKAEYNLVKELCNSLYGMCVTSPLREDIIYQDNMWPTERDPTGAEDTRTEEEIEADKAREEKKRISKIIRYNHNMGRFTAYIWGVFCTAWARRQLWTAILHLGTDYVYSDTDSVKIRHAQQHRQWFADFNSWNIEQMMIAMDHHGLPREMIMPKTIKGQVKPLGVWEFDGHYQRFRTQGAKRYLVQYSDDPRNDPTERGEIDLTVAGVAPAAGAEFLRERYGVPGCFDTFTDRLVFPPGHAGKLTHTYIDHPIDTTLTDYLGFEREIHELSVVHMVPAGYKLSMSQAFLDYVRHVQVDYR